LKRSTSAAVAGAFFLSHPEDLLASSEEKLSRVVLIRNKDVLDPSNAPRKAVLEAMLDEAVTTLLDEEDPARAWKRLIKPDDIVGIKSNVWSSLPTPPELETALEKRVISAGVVEKNVSIDDRGILRNRVFRRATALINVRPSRTHHWSGVGSLIKNYIMFVPRPEAYHGDSCADLAKIWQLPNVRGKTRLNILVLLTPLFHSVGPHDYSAKYTWKYNGLLVGFDPVAVDATGVRILIAKRREFFEDVRPITPMPKHVFLAETRHQLGTADPEKIDLITLGWEEDRLI
jgi:hypothetical protein